MVINKLNLFPHIKELSAKANSKTKALLKNKLFGFFSS